MAAELTAPAPKRRRPWLIAIAALVAVVFVLGGLKAAQIAAMVKKGKSAVPPPQTVTSAKVERDAWPVTSAAVGTVIAERATRVSVEVPGMVTEIFFTDGSTVTEGAPLVRLDIASEKAQLAGLAADALLARTNLRRAQYLSQHGAAATAELQAARARSDQAAAAVLNLKTVIEKKTVRAPFTGRIGIREVELGQMLNPGAAIASLQTVDPMRVELALPQVALGRLELGQRVSVHVSGLGKREFRGTVSTLNPELDTATRNVRVRATVGNPDGRLLPGMFADVEVYSGEAAPVLVIPATAVLYAPYGDSVFVLKGDEAPFTVEQRFVRVGERRGDFVAISRGLEAQEQVVSTGAFKLKNGMKVVVDNALAPRASVAPKVEDR